MHEWGDLSKLSQIQAKIGSKFFKNQEILLTNLAQNWTDWYMNGSLFLEKLVFVWVYFQILRRHIPAKTKLKYLWGLGYEIVWQTVNKIHV